MKKEIPSQQTHWERVYIDNDHRSCSWYQSESSQSLDWLSGTKIPTSARIFDVGGGAHGLLQGLIDRHYYNVTTIDISQQALRISQQILSEYTKHPSSVNQLRWHHGDVTALDIDCHCDIWHDRAVLHFLTDLNDQLAYVKAIEKHLVTGGHALISGFAVDGPLRCSSLPIIQHTRQSLSRLLGEDFIIIDDWQTEHMTPANKIQLFHYFHLKRIA